MSRKVAMNAKEQVRRVKKIMNDPSVDGPCGLISLRTLRLCEK